MILFLWKILLGDLSIGQAFITTFGGNRSHMSSLLWLWAPQNLPFKYQGGLSIVKMMDMIILHPDQAPSQSLLSSTRIEVGFIFFLHWQPKIPWSLKQMTRIIQFHSQLKQKDLECHDKASRVLRLPLMLCVPAHLFISVFSLG